MEKIKVGMKFRAWDTKLKVWIATGFHVIGEVTMFEVIQEHCFETKGELTSLERMGDVLLDVCIDRQDINGVDIYENDIISCYVDYGPGGEHKQTLTVPRVLPMPNSSFNSIIWERDIEVIGNKYEDLDNSFEI